MFDIMNLQQNRVALLAGGKSSEREISIASGKGARAALEEAGFSVETLDPADVSDLKRLMDGEFDVAFLCTHGRGGEDGVLQGFLETIGMPYTGSGVFGSAVCMDKTAAKVLYRTAGIPTPASVVLRKSDWKIDSAAGAGIDIDNDTGTGADTDTVVDVDVDVDAGTGTAIDVDTDTDTDAATGTGINTDADTANTVDAAADGASGSSYPARVDGFAEEDAEGSGVGVRRDRVERLIGELGQKCVIKAACEGSSVGVYIEEGAEAIERAIDEAFEYDDVVLVEQYVSGVELTAPVLEDDGLRALPIIEIVPKNESYDFESKYAPGGSEHVCPARISDEATARIQEWAKTAHVTLGCSGVSRTDFILDGNGDAWALETNTLPGMTETSLLPDAARAAGMTFPEVCTALIADALRKAR